MPEVTIEEKEVVEEETEVATEEITEAVATEAEEVAIEVAATGTNRNSQLRIDNLQLIRNVTTKENKVP